MIQVSETAYKKIKELLSRRGKGAGIRIGVRTTGCSGMAYMLEYIDKYEPEEGTINYNLLHISFLLKYFT